MPFNIPKIEYGSVVPTTVSVTYPPKDEGEIDDTNDNTVVTLSGLSQTVTNYIEITRKVTFGALTEAQLAAFKTFSRTWAGLGKSFKFYEDVGDVTYTTYQLKDLKFLPKRTSSAGVNAYLYQVQLTLRRVLGSVAREDFLQVELLNNQSSPVSIAGQILDFGSYRSVKIFFEIFRKTDSSERVANGFLTATYKESTASWDVTPAGVYDGDAHEVVFSISAGGQLKYTSDNMAGTNYEGTLLLKNFTITG